MHYAFYKCALAKVLLFRAIKKCNVYPYPIGSMVLAYMLTWLGYIDGIHVTIYSSTMDPSWDMLLGFIWFPMVLYGFLIVFRVRIVFASQGPDPIVEVRMLCWKRTNHGFYHEFLGIYHGFTMDLSWFIYHGDIHRFDHDFCGGLKIHLRPEANVCVSSNGGWEISVA